jgi:outer membrane protein OmpA-like peptidoglycan-associated protein
VSVKLYIVATIILALAGCASKPAVLERVSERVILLPSETGKPSGVVVKTRDSEVVLNNPYAAVEIRGAAMTPGTSTAEEVNRRYGELLSAQPKKPQPFTMFFVRGTDEFTPPSKLAFEAARKQVASWSGAEIVVIGHTDRTGTEDFNDNLARKRAELVASRLVASGVPPDRIEVAARGERELLIPTADGVSEPRNRRVEIKVR